MDIAAVGTGGGGIVIELPLQAYSCVCRRVKDERWRRIAPNLLLV